MRKCVILFIVLVLSQTAYSKWDDVIKDNPNYKGILSPKCETIEIEFATVEYPWIFSSSIYAISLFDNYLIYKLDIPNDGTYQLAALDENQLTLFCILTEDSMYCANEIHNRKHLSSLDINLKKGQNCILLIKIFEKGATKIKLTFCFNSNTSLTKIKSIPLNSVVKKRLKLFSDKSDIIREKKLDIYDIAELFDKNTWNRIQVDAEDFTPILWGLNKDFIIITEDESPITSKKASISFNENDNIKYVAVGAYFSDKIQYDNSTTFTYTINSQIYQYNPSSNFFEKSIYHLKNPLVSFIVGILICGLISLFFYYLSLRKKKITYEIIVDEVIVDEVPADDSICVNINNENIYKCCLYGVRFTNTGHLRIEGTYVTIPLKVRLDNIIRIVDFKIYKTGNGWGEIIKVSDNELIIPFEYINVEDRIYIRIFAEINDDYDKNGGIQLNVFGKIAEATIKKKKKELFQNAFIFLTTFFLYLSIIPSTIVIFTHSSPPWFSAFFNYIFPFLFLCWFISIVLHKPTRRSIISLPRRIIYSIKEIIK